MADLAVWKTALPLVHDEQLIQLPVGAKALHVGCLGDSDDVCVWWLVDRLAVLETRQLMIVETGLPLTRDDLVYIGTTQQQDCYVWHVFEVKP